MKIVNKKRRQAGYTLLEYCAGAAIMTGIVWVALSQLGNSLSAFLNQLSSWADNRASSIVLTTNSGSEQN